MEASSELDLSIPAQKGKYSLPDDSGRHVNNILVGNCVIGF